MYLLLKYIYFWGHAAQLECCQVPNFYTGSCSTEVGFDWGAPIQCPQHHDLVVVRLCTRMIRKTRLKGAWFEDRSNLFIKMSYKINRKFLEQPSRVFGTLGTSMYYTCEYSSEMYYSLYREPFLSFLLLLLSEESSSHVGWRPGTFSLPFGIS